MTRETTICERLRDRIASPFAGRQIPLTKAEATELATLIEAQQATIEGLAHWLSNARVQLQHYNACHKELESTYKLLDQIDAALAKVPQQ